VRPPSTQQRIAEHVQSNSHSSSSFEHVGRFPAHAPHVSHVVADGLPTSHELLGEPELVVEVVAVVVVVADVGNPVLVVVGAPPVPVALGNPLWVPCPPAPPAPPVPALELAVGKSPELDVVVVVPPVPLLEDVVLVVAVAAVKPRLPPCAHESGSAMTKPRLPQRTNPRSKGRTERRMSSCSHNATR
jgi:hypothetical protein